MVDKTSLAFILTPPTPTPSPRHGSYDFKRLPIARHRSPRHAFKVESHRHTLVRPLTAYLATDATRIDRVRVRPLTTEELPRKSSKFCIVDGCTSRAKHARRCWKHGGSVQCKVPDCVNRAKSKGVCWSHGGGSPCSVCDCDTIAVSNGFCWAHGGGKRCRERGCSRPAYERTRNYCAQHFEDLQRAATALV